MDSPNDHVDVIAVLPSSEGKGMVATTEAERLALAQALGKLTLVLRSPENKGIRKSAAPTTVKALFTKSSGGKQ